MTKYKPVNDHVILEKITEEETVSGIILTQNKSVYYKVIATQDDSCDILDKQVILSQEPINLEANYYVAPVNNIVAFK